MALSLYFEILEQMHSLSPMVICVGDQHVAFTSSVDDKKKLALLQSMFPPIILLEEVYGRIFQISLEITNTVVIDSILQCYSWCHGHKGSWSPYRFPMEDFQD